MRFDSSLAHSVKYDEGTSKVSSSNAPVRTDPLWATGVAVFGGLLAALCGGFFLALGFHGLIG
jgi:hypothetical protein